MAATAQPKVAIIGAGPGGLASALLLAKSGVEVTVFERSGSVGGRNKVFERDGFKFDLGPTFFHYPEVIEDIFKAIGMDAHEELKLHRLDMNYRLIFGQGGQLDCTSDLDEMTERIRGLSGDFNAEASSAMSLTTASNSTNQRLASKNHGTGQLTCSPSEPCELQVCCDLSALLQRTS